MVKLENSHFIINTNSSCAGKNVCVEIIWTPKEDLPLVIMNQSSKLEAEIMPCQLGN